MGRMDGKVVFITGAARGQGRASALLMAQEGADIIAVDICEQSPSSVPYPLASKDDLEETAAAVRDLDRRIVAVQADTRDIAQLQAAVDRGVAELGGLDVVLCNAAICPGGRPVWEISEEEWQDVIDVNLSGTWRTLKATIPAMIDQGRGGSIVITASVGSMIGYGGLGDYTAAKHGVAGLMHTLVNEVSVHDIRVNTVNPTSVNTPMIQNDALRDVMGVARDAPLEEYGKFFASGHALDHPWVEPEDIARAALFLASDEARFVTGVMLPVDLGFLAKVH